MRSGWIIAVLLALVSIKLSSSYSGNNWYSPRSGHHSGSQWFSPRSSHSSRSEWWSPRNSHQSQSQWSSSSNGGSSTPGWQWLADTFAAVRLSINAPSASEKNYTRDDPGDLDIDGHFKDCSGIDKEREETERMLVEMGKIRKPDTRCHDLYLNRNWKTDSYRRQEEMRALAFESVTNKISEKYCLSDDNLLNDLPSRLVKGENFERARAACEQSRLNTPCDPGSRYRTADGTCNNLRNPRWGSNGACFRRILPARYVGASGFRQSVLGGALPNPRDLSINIHNHLNRPTTYVNHMYMFFGQLLDHDITQTPMSVTMDNQEIQCCNQTGGLHPQCAPIFLRQNDPFFAQFGTTCINFVRSAICPTCSLGSRQQLNQITAFIDASFIYGNSLNETENLRTLDGTGRLRFERTSVGDLMPPSPNPRSDLCSFVNTSDICFEAGDARANQHTTLASLHTVFVREHNRLATELRRINPRWNDETLFQEARRIVGAEMQVITYKEYLPLTLGKERMSYFSLWVSRDYLTNYDESVDPTLYNEFSTAAFRFGHSLISSLVSRSGPGGLLRDEFFQPFPLRTGVIGPLLQGVTRTSAQFFDRHLVPDVTNYLYRIRDTPAGLDLAAINIQRGRDHGAPTYAQMVEYCSENKFSIRRFNDLVTNRIMSSDNARLLERNYRDVRDVDLWTGVIAETYSEDAVLGPTGICVVGTQFHNLKFGDRFYFEHRNQKGSFTWQQIQQLRTTSLSKIICANTDATQMPLNAFLFTNRNNPAIYCRNVRNLDLSYWRS